MSRSEHHGNDHNVERGWGDRIEWDTPRSRVLATRDHETLVIAEGLVEIGLDEPRTCWDLGVEYEHECDVIALNMLNADILSQLAAMDRWDRDGLPAGHVNLLPLMPRASWSEPDYWNIEDDTRTTHEGESA